MTRNEMIKAAHAAGAALENYGGAWHIEMSETALQKLVDAITQTEREACAAIADQHSAPLVAGKIRKRGEDGA